MSIKGRNAVGVKSPLVVVGDVFPGGHRSRRRMGRGIGIGTGIGIGKVGPPVSGPSAKKARSVFMGSLGFIGR